MILIGPDSARFTNAKASGSLFDAAMYNSSHIYASPQEEVAVNALAPAADAPMVALIELCSLSTGINSVSTNPFAAKEAKSIVPVETYKKMIDELAEKKPVYSLWGGEPFLYPDLFELVRYIQSKGSFCSINTNGTLLEKYAEQIVKDKWNVIFVSLDAFNDVNDEMRGHGAPTKPNLL